MLFKENTFILDYLFTYQLLDENQGNIILTFWGTMKGNKHNTRLESVTIVTNNKPLTLRVVASNKCKGSYCHNVCHFYNRRIRIHNFISLGTMPASFNCVRWTPLDKFVYPDRHKGGRIDGRRDGHISMVYSTITSYGGITTYRLWLKKKT